MCSRLPLLSGTIAPPGDKWLRKNAAAAIANSNPWKTGFAAFKLSNAKIMVPFVFCYSPVMLLVLPGWNWPEFLETTLTCALGTFMLGIAFVGYGWAPMPMFHRVLLGIGGVFMAQPSRTAEMIAVPGRPCN